MTTFRIEKTEISNKSSALEELIQLARSQDARIRPTWVADLPRLFSAHDLQDVTVDVKDSPPDLAFVKHECNLIIHELILGKTKDYKAVRRLHEIMGEVLAETRDGSCWAFTRRTAVGRKGV